jgi:hypothetical protein
METEFELDPVHPWAPFADAIERQRNAGVGGPSMRDQIMTELNRIAADEFTTAAGTRTSRAAVVAMLDTASASELARVHAGLASTPSPAQPKES